MAGRVIMREWTGRGALARKVKHMAYGYDITINGGEYANVLARLLEAFLVLGGDHGHD